MRKSNWHLRIALTSTATLMSFATALVIPQFVSPKPALPEMSVPFHAAASEPVLDTECAESTAASDALILNTLDANVPVEVEIYSRDAAATLPEVQLNAAPDKNCIHLNSGYVAPKVVADVSFAPATKAVCKQAAAVALKVE